LNNTDKSKKKKTFKNSINVEYVEGTLQSLFSYRATDLLSSRVKFKIQDLIDEYELEWKQIIEEERMLVDSEGF
jgi:hypothetical protein